ncbi:hypothetical protein NC653_000027 [Populus alba x Populus x berolinensis]|uniref:Uncharacterized protein n=1 Tax=Populus alba x Populus x berolinensis TaxID=444605 RepID=A0AAD6WE00_9ROSI|nr:hypothetical protein NC653_000027 [Populus alba x Populus x berolinensis]
MRAVRGGPMCPITYSDNIIPLKNWLATTRKECVEEEPKLVENEEIEREEMELVPQDESEGSRTYGQSRSQIRGIIETNSMVNEVLFNQLLMGFFPSGFLLGKMDIVDSQKFPTFGIDAMRHFGWSWEWIVPYIVNLSLLIGAVLSYGEYCGHLYVNLRENAVHYKKKLFDEQKQNYILPRRDYLHFWIGIVGYVIVLLSQIIAVPIMFTQISWFYVRLYYVLAPSLAFCYAYGAGLTVILPCEYNYGKADLFVLDWKFPGGKWCGLDSNCWMDFKTEHLTVTSPSSLVFRTTVIGTAPIGLRGGSRNRPIIGVAGFSALPQY